MKGCEPMMTKHSDCEHFCSIDVAKGLCRMTGAIVLIDTPVCAQFEELAKCANCRHFSVSGSEEFGNCQGFAKEYWTTAQTRAVCCENHVRCE